MLSRRKHGDILHGIHSHCETKLSMSQEVLSQPVEEQMQAEQHFSLENLQLLKQQLSKVNKQFNEAPCWQFTRRVAGGDRGTERERRIFRRPSVSPATS